MEGYNFEDAIVLSERLVKDDVYSSVHCNEVELEVRDTKGQEELTPEIPNVGEDATKVWMKMVSLGLELECLKEIF